MQIDDSLYTAFLKEMEALDTFRVSYRKRYPETPIDPEDPDVRRLMEAMALLSARTRRAAEKHINRTHLRMFQQFFPYLLTPVPSMAVVQAIPGRSLSDGITCPEGMVMSLFSESVGQANFRTLQPLNILPIKIQGVQVVSRPGGRQRLIVTMETPYPRNDEIGRISLFVNHLNDYESSLAIYMDLCRYVERVTVCFNGETANENRHRRCGVSFGLARSGPESTHLLERERRFFHFPWQELFVHVDVTAPERRWQSLDLCFDLSASWEGQGNLTPDVFHLFAVPVINLLHDRARPVISDGTRESCSLTHPDAEKKYALHSVKGVFEVTPQGLAPLDPALLSDSSPCWEVGADGSGTSRLNLNIPMAFEAPKTLSVTARWYQPWFSDAVSKRIEVGPYARMVDGVSWGIAVPPVMHADVAMRENIDDFLRYLTLSNRVELSRHNLLDILGALGVNHESRFAPVLELLEDVVVEPRASRSSGAGNVVHTYTLIFRACRPEMEPLVQLFIEHIGLILEAWIASASIEVRRAEP